MAELSDDELIEQYLAGDERQLQPLFSRHAPAVYGLMLRFTSSSQEAEDLAQTAFIKAWQHLRSFDRSRRFSAWLLAIARNTAIDHMRKKRPVEFAALTEDHESAVTESLADPAPLPEDLAHTGMLSRAVWQEISQLPERTGTVLLLHLQQELTFQEISEILHEPLDTVKSRYRRALITIRKNLSHTQEP